MMQVDDVIKLIERELEGSDEGEPNMIKNTPDQRPDELLKDVEDDITGDTANMDEDPDDEDDYPDQYDEMGIASEMVDRTVLEQDSAYQTYFRGVMSKHGIKGIRGLSKEKRSTFFKDVSAGWKKHKKVKEGKEILNNEKHQQIYEQYKKYFKFMMEECGIKDLNTLNEVEQAEFMSLVNEAFQTMNELMQKPGDPIGNPMNTFDNTIDTMKSRLRPERRVRQRADAAKATRRPVAPLIRR